MPEVRLYKSFWIAIKLIFFSLPFVLFSLFNIINKEYNQTISWVSLCFFGLAILLGLFNFFDKRPQIIIDETGITDNIAFKGLICWDWITDAYLKNNTSYYRSFRTGKLKFLSVKLNSKAVSKLKGNRAIMRFSKNFGVQEISIPLFQLKKINGQKLVDFIKAMAKSDFIERQKLLLTIEL